MHSFDEYKKTVNDHLTDLIGDAGIGPHMAADGGTHVDDPAVRDVIAHVPEFLCQDLAVGPVGGVHHIDGEIGVRLPLLQTLTQVVHPLLHAHSLGWNLHPALVRHPDNGLDLGQGPQLVHRMTDPAAPVQVFQGIDAGIEHDPVPEGLHRFHDLGGRLSFLPQPHRVLYQQPLAAGGVFAVHHKAAVAVRFLTGHHGALVGAAEGGGQADIHRLVTGSRGTGKQIQQALGRGLGGFGGCAGLGQQFKEPVLGQVHGFQIFLLAHHDPQGDAVDIQLLIFGSFKIRSGIGNDSDHGAAPFRRIRRFFPGFGISPVPPPGRASYRHTLRKE